MRKVVDSGFLRSKGVVDYLSRNKNNQIVLTDYACMESLKGRSTTNFERQIKYISKRPDQVIVLKGMRKICRTSPRTGGLQKRLVDKAQTESFRHFCHRYQARGLSSAANIDDILTRSDEATLYIDSLINDQAAVQSMFLDLGNRTYRSAVMKICSDEEFQQFVGKISNLCIEGLVSADYCRFFNVDFDTNS